MSSVIKNIDLFNPVRNENLNIDFLLLKSHKLENEAGINIEGVNINKALQNQNIQVWCYPESNINLLGYGCENNSQYTITITYNSSNTNTFIFWDSYYKLNVQKILETIKFV